MHFVARLLSRITMYRLMLYYLSVLLGIGAALSAFGILPYSAATIVLQTAAFVVVCWLLNTLIARARGVHANIESTFITALILAAIVGPLSLPRDWLVVAVTVVAAIASKYLFVIHRSHIFNPAAVGVLVSALLLNYPASWWIGTREMLPAVLIGGVLMMAKLRRWHLVASFFATYLGALAIAGLLQGSSLQETALFVSHFATDALLLFFMFVMLVEPLTAPQTVRGRAVFGALVGLALFAVQRLAPALPYLLELSLLLGNAGTRLFYRDFRQALVLRRKEPYSTAIANFWFDPTRAFAFVPGQFLEYTYAHSRPDTRGMRRYFSIASSPTEPQVLLTARFADNGSSFKKALRIMEPGQEIVASKVAGDFVLPSDPTRKLAFIAGGIGITPFRSMVKYLLDTGQSRDIVALYAARSDADLVFRDVFEQAQQKFGLRTAYALADKQQMIDEAFISQAVPDYRERLFYISGPEPMVVAITKVLRKLGVPRWHIKRDFFPGY